MKLSNQFFCTTVFPKLESKPFAVHCPVMFIFQQFIYLTQMHSYINDVGSKSFIKNQNCALVVRSELFKMLVCFMMEEKI